MLNVSLVFSSVQVAGQWHAGSDHTPTEEQRPGGEERPAGR